MKSSRLVRRLVGLALHRPRAGRWLLPLGLCACFVAACDDDSLPPNADAAADAADGGGTADGGAPDGQRLDAGDGGDAGDDAGSDASGDTSAPPPLTAVGVAILSTDRVSTALSLAALDATTISKDQCLHSGSTPPALSVALSGDVVLPTSLQPNHQIALLDRKNGTVTWVAPDTCTVVRQMNTGNGFASNPYDLIADLPTGKGYVPRYNVNPNNPAEGSDILIIDTTTGQAKGRIDLRPFVTPTLPPAMPFLPFPTRGVRVADRVYVALNHFTADYSDMSDGRLVVIDVNTDAVVDTIALGGRKNCGTVTPVVDASGLPSTVFLVGCNGPFGPGQIDRAGVVRVDVSTTPATVDVVASTAFGRPVSGFDVAAIDDAFAATVVNGEFGMAPFDAVWTFDLLGGTPTALYEADTWFSLSIGIDAARRRLYVLDASKTEPLVHVFDVPVGGGTPVESTSFASNPITGLPPRQIGFY